jgi:hypothetical protein
MATIAATTGQIEHWLALTSMLVTPEYRHPSLPAPLFAIGPAALLVGDLLDFESLLVPVNDTSLDISLE